MTNASNVRVAVTGAVYVGATGTTLPDDATTPVGPSLDDVGYISEEGVTESHDADTQDVIAWQNGDNVRTLQTSHNVTFNFSMIETSEVTMRTFYGNFDGDSENGEVHITGQQLGNQSWVISVLDGDHVIRIVIPDGQITERGDVEYTGQDATGREITVTAYPDEDGVKAYIYMENVFSS